MTKKRITDMFPDELDVRTLSNRRRMLLRPFRCQDDGTGLNFTVPEGFDTDFASVPRLFWAVIPPTGPYEKPAVGHDYLYGAQLASRKTCDRFFLNGMKYMGVSYWKRQVMYRAVRLFGWHRWNKNKPAVTAAAN